jgi:hypothetical protein
VASTRGIGGTARGGVELTVMPAVARRYDEAIRSGEADLDCAAPFRWPLE